MWWKSSEPVGKDTEFPALPSKLGRKARLAAPTKSGVAWLSSVWQGRGFAGVGP
jgi:hypothetical protein